MSDDFDSDEKEKVLNYKELLDHILASWEMDPDGITKQEVKAVRDGLDHVVREWRRKIQLKRGYMEMYERDEDDE